MLKFSIITHQLPTGSKTVVDIDYHHEALNLTKPSCVVTIQSLIPNNSKLINAIESCIKREINKLNKNNL